MVEKGLARCIVEMELFKKRNEAYKQKHDAIVSGEEEHIIKMFDEIGKLYNGLYKQVENMTFDN